MQRITVTLFSILVPVVAFTQTTITGNVTDLKQQPLPGVNVYIKGTLDGATSDGNGVFHFTADASGKQILIASMIGMESFAREVDLSGTAINLSIQLRATVNQLNAVEITAGSFSAGDVNKAAVLSSLDIATTAGAAADIVGALQTLPGVMPSMEQSGLVVRGGNVSESKAYFDGILVNKMFPGSLPDISHRGRFSPFMFKGTSFSTGAYSAQYGDALSSVMLMESHDIEKESKSEVGIMSVGLDAGRVQRFDKGSVEVKGSYYNLKPIFNLLEQNTHWTHEPESVQGSVFYKQKTAENGLLKIYSVYERAHTGLITYNHNDVSRDSEYDIKTNSLYLNTTWTQFLNEKWKVFAGIGYGDDLSKIDIDSNRVRLTNRSVHSRGAVTHYFGKISDVSLGLDYMKFPTRERFNSLSREAQPQLSSSFVESNMFISNMIAVRPGIRLQHSSISNQLIIDPRFSLALKLDETSQLSAGWGIYHQLPDDKYRYDSVSLNMEQASHVVFNYQYQKNNRTFRSEIYYKDYRHLVIENNINRNGGYGYATGLDLFWRDSKSIRYADYWVSYSWLDTKRKYHDYPSSATPPFVAEHVLNVVGKYFIRRFKINAGATYSFASGRTYYNPGDSRFLGSRTRNYHNFSVNTAYLTSVAGNFTIVYFSIENVPGIKNVYGYRYTPDGHRRPITPSAPRSIFLGMFITIR
jgi:hypothetical protein